MFAGPKGADQTGADIVFLPGGYVKGGNFYMRIFFPPLRLAILILLFYILDPFDTLLTLHKYHNSASLGGGGRGAAPPP